MGVDGETYANDLYSKKQPRLRTTRLVTTVSPGREHTGVKDGGGGVRLAQVLNMSPSYVTVLNS